MSQYTSYYLYQKFEKRGDQDWLPVYPNVYSADGDGTMSPVIKQENDSACGYTPPVEPQYRWVDLDPATDYYCLDCGTDGVKVSGTYGESGETFSVNCDSSTTLTTSEIPSGVTYAKIGNCVTAIGEGAFMSRSSLSGVSIPITVSTIGASAFTYSYGLVECVLPYSVTSIGEYAFKDCVSLENIILWDTITSIGNNAFENCDYLIGVNIPTGITNVPASGFSNCGALSEVTIHTGITSIGNSAFRGCTGLVSITVKATTPPTLGDYAFGNTNDCPIYVPSQSVDIYKAASGWSNYAYRIQAIT